MITGLSGTSTNQRSNASINPLSLFRNGEQGVWYDPSDIKLGWRKNLLIQSEDLTNPVWSKSQTTVSGNKIIPSTVDTIHYVTQYVSTLYAGDTYTLSLQAINSGYDWLSIECHTGVAYLYVKFNVNNGTIGSISAGLTATNPTLIDGKWALSVTMATPVSVSTPVFTIFVSPTINLSYAGDGTSGVIVDKIQVERGASATSYQKITDGIQDYYTYHPLPTLYQDYQGTQPVTAVEQQVGLMLDKSKGLTLGNELITNGDFSSDTWWTKDSTVTISGGLGIFTNTSVSSGLFRNNILEIGKFYRVSYTIKSLTAGAIRILLGTSSSTIKSSAGVYTEIIQCSGNGQLYIQAFSGAPTNATIDDISVKEIVGSKNHAYQSTSASRPTLSARVNLLTKTEDLSDAVWVKQPGNIITSNVATAPDGTTTADKLDWSAGDVELGVYTQVQVSSVPSYSRSIYVRADVAGGQVILKDPSLTIGQPTFVLTTSWQRITLSEGSGSTFAGIWIAKGTNAPAYIYVWGADLRLASTPASIPTYQRVNTSTDYDTTGFPPYLKCDGVDDGMVTNSIDFTTTDKVTVVSGMRKLTDSGVGTFLELGDGDVSNGVFQIRTPWNGVGGYTFSDRGTLAGPTIPDSSYDSPKTNVLTAQFAINPPLIIGRRNGVQVATTTSPKGTGTYGNYQLALFKRLAGNLPFNGHMYGLIIRGATTPTATIQKIEKYMNKKVGKIY